MVSRFTQHPAAGRSELTSSAGKLCGSQWVNQEFLKWLKNKYYSPDELRNTLRKIGWSEVDFFAQASEAFEYEKIRFSNRKTVYDIHVNSHGGHGQGRAFINWNLWVTSPQ